MKTKTKVGIAGALLGTFIFGPRGALWGAALADRLHDHVTAMNAENDNEPDKDGEKDAS